jgi:hypothetical protein
MDAPDPETAEKTSAAQSLLGRGIEQTVILAMRHPQRGRTKPITRGGVAGAEHWEIRPSGKYRGGASKAATPRLTPACVGQARAAADRAELAPSLYKAVDRSTGTSECDGEYVGHVRALQVDTDHSWSDRRITLQSEIIKWLTDPILQQAH